ncbi:hypothetical protein TNIN_196821 [Trichonephila inaurata madagascariensis]|uniref:Secreted protein n=1 Tax=Trichonephila inaurata madagascariensis TaxID=2747483 RepID=A0A8X6YVA4_9ARAC|nr:hypothetical protein TNIN_196821 [Trichonephila inaurata madagascariensis]
MSIFPEIRRERRLPFELSIFRILLVLLAHCFSSPRTFAESSGWSLHPPTGGESRLMGQSEGANDTSFTSLMMTDDDTMHHSFFHPSSLKHRSS